jgi:uncharacterized protein (TIGR02265 family)
MEGEREEVDFRAGVEGLFVHGIGERMTERLRERLAGVGIDVSAPLLPAYPRRVFARGCELAAEELYPGVPPDEALRRLGHDYIRGLLRSTVGRGLFRMLGFIGIRQTLLRMSRAFRSGDNYTECTVSPMGSNIVKVVLTQVNGHPTFSQGIFEASLEALGARDFQVRGLWPEGEGYAYELHWQDGRG